MTRAKQMTSPRVVKTTPCAAFLCLLLMLSYLCCCGSYGKDALSEDDAARLLSVDDGLLSSEEESLRTREELRLFAAMWCRGSKAQWPLKKGLAEVGTRSKKYFCLVGDLGTVSTSSSTGYFGWLFPGTRRAVLSVTVCERNVGVHERALLERALRVDHPLLMPVFAADFPRPDRYVAIREWYDGGSLRDLLHNATPDQEQTTKYDRVGTPLTETRIAYIGRGLLEALLILRPLGERVAMHVHLANVFLCGPEGTVPRISEWEQGLLGLPSHLEPYFADLRRSVEPSAAALALCIYEMACGFELDGLPAVIPPITPPVVREALETLLPPPNRTKQRSKATAESIYTLEDARTLPLFAKTDYGTAGFAAIQVPPPLPTEMVQQAKDAQAALTRGAAPSR